MCLCRVDRAIACNGAAREEDNTTNYGVLLQYLHDLRCRGRVVDGGGVERELLLPYAFSPPHLVASLAASHLLGQAARLLYSLLALPAALFSEQLARQHLASHLSLGRLPFALIRLEEAAVLLQKRAESGANARERRMGWVMYAQECAVAINCMLKMKEPERR